MVLSIIWGSFVGVVMGDDMGFGLFIYVDCLCFLFLLGFVAGYII